MIPHRQITLPHCRTLSSMALRCLSLAALCIYFAPLRAQHDVAAAFMEKYVQFVDTAWKAPKITTRMWAYNDSVFKAYTQMYHKTVKKQMNAAQLETYTEYRTRYIRQRAGRKASKQADHTGQKLDSVAGKTATGAEKVGAKIKGFFRGLFSGDK